MEFGAVAGMGVFEHAVNGVEESGRDGHQDRHFGFAVLRQVLPELGRGDGRRQVLGDRLRVTGAGRKKTPSERSGDRYRGLGASAFQLI